MGPLCIGVTIYQLEPRPARRRGHRRPRASACRPSLDGRHQLHAGPRRREGAAGTPPHQPRTS